MAMFIGGDNQDENHEAVRVWYQVLPARLAN